MAGNRFYSNPLTGGVIEVLWLGYGAPVTDIFEQHFLAWLKKQHIEVYERMRFIIICVVDFSYNSGIYDHKINIYEATNGEIIHSFPIRQISSNKYDGDEQHQDKP
jgi:hypothetical protein